MALYLTCQTSIHNIEFCHGCFAVLIVYRFMLSLFMSCVMNMVRLDDLVWILVCCVFGLALAFLLVHPKGGRPGDARVVTSYTSVVLRYAGSFG